MREILFRGRISKNEWVYGLPIEGEPLMGRGKETCIVSTIRNNGQCGFRILPAQEV